MNLIGWMLLLYPIRLYYRRKWEGKHPGDPLDIAWVKKRIDCAMIERHGKIIRCHFDHSRDRHLFLIEGTGALEWHTFEFSRSGGGWRSIAN
jgi:hypothetical protein